MRACQREGLFRIERDRQGVIRLFPGNIMQPFVGADDPEDEDDLQPETRRARLKRAGRDGRAIEEPARG